MAVLVYFKVARLAWVWHDRGQRSLPLVALEGTRIQWLACKLCQDTVLGRPYRSERNTRWASQYHWHPPSTAQMLGPNWLTFRRESSEAHRDRDIAQSPNSFAFTAIKLWNSLPIRNKEIESIVVFKKKLKEFVFYLRMIDSVNGLIFFTLTDLLLVFTVFYLNFLYICCLMTYDIFTCYCKDPVGNKL